MEKKMMEQKEKQEKEEKYLSGNRKYLSFSLFLPFSLLYSTFFPFCDLYHNDISIEREFHTQTNTHVKKWLHLCECDDEGKLKKLH